MPTKLGPNKKRRRRLSARSHIYALWRLYLYWGLGNPAKRGAVKVSAVSIFEFYVVFAIVPPNFLIPSASRIISGKNGNLACLLDGHPAVTC